MLTRPPGCVVLSHLTANGFGAAISGVWRDAGSMWGEADFGLTAADAAIRFAGGGGSGGFGASVTTGGRGSLWTGMGACEAAFSCDDHGLQELSLANASVVGRVMSSTTGID